jgi:hypothetical protein
MNLKPKTLFFFKYFRKPKTESLFIDEKEGGVEGVEEPRKITFLATVSLFKELDALLMVPIIIFSGLR